MIKGPASALETGNVMTITRMMVPALLIVLLGNILGSNTAAFSITPQIRLCVPEVIFEKCEQLTALSPDSGVVCQSARDRVDCARQLEIGAADAMSAEPEDMYLATQLTTNQDRLNVPVQMRANDDKPSPWRYQAVAVVRADFKPSGGLPAALKGLSSCHTGIGRNVGYKIPVTKLNKLGVLQIDEAAHSPREAELRALSELFSSACIVGKWSADAVQDARLKTQYSNLCALCEHPSQCDYPDNHASYDGALRCLQHGGDIAWTKPVFVRKHFQEPGSEPNKFAYLCPDGTVKPLGDLSAISAPCAWASRPWPGVLSAISGHQQALRDALQNLVTAATAASRFDLIKSVITLGDNVTMIPVDPIEPGRYLEEAGYKDVIERGATAAHQPVKICVLGSEELEKCRLLAKASFSRDLRPVLECVQKPTSLECSKAIETRELDLWIADGAEAVFQETKNPNLHVVAIETLPRGGEDKIIAIASTKAEWTSLDKAIKSGAEVCMNKLDNGVRVAAHQNGLLENLCEPHVPSDALACFEEKSNQAIALVRQRQFEEALIAPKKAELRKICKHESLDDSCTTLLTVPPQSVLASTATAAKERNEAALHLMLGAGKLFAKRPEVFRLFGKWNQNGTNILVSDIATGFTSLNIEESDIPERKTLHQVFSKVKC